VNRSWVRPAIFVYWGYVLIATFYPFELSPDFTPSLSHFAGGLETLFLDGWRWLGLRDFLLNILLFLPCGALLHRLWTTEYCSKLLTMVLIVLCGASSSFLIELGQAFASRNSSALDVVANTLGTTVGALVYG
jgi:glycopeptide antibiotics resistance protein